MELLRQVITRGRIAVPAVRLHGVIAARPGAGGMRGLSLESLERPLQRAFQSKRSPAVMLIVNSPGGSPVQSHLISKRIRQLAKEHDKKVYAFAEDVAASGGYMLMCAGDRLFADPSSLVGSVGVVGGGFGFVEAIQKLGVERRLLTAGKHKPVEPEEDRRIRALMDRLHEEFKRFVVERRGERLAEARREDVMQAMVFTGTEAKEAGLVDELGDVHTFIRAEFGPKAALAVVNPGSRSPLADLLPWASRAGGELGAAAATGALGALEERALWSRFGVHC